MAGLLESLAQIAPSVMSGFGNKTETFDRVRGIRQENEAQADQKERKERLRKFVQLMTQTDGPVTTQKLYQNAQAAGIDPDDAAKVGMDFVNFRKAAAPEKQKFSRALGNGMTQQVEVPPDSALLGSGKWMPGTLSGSPRKPELIDGVNPATGKPMYATLGQNGTISQLQGIIPQENKGTSDLYALKTYNPDGTITTSFVPKQGSYYSGVQADMNRPEYKRLDDIENLTGKFYQSNMLENFNEETAGAMADAIRFATEYAKQNPRATDQEAAHYGRSMQRANKKVADLEDKLPVANPTERPDAASLPGVGGLFRGNEDTTAKVVKQLRDSGQQKPQIESNLRARGWSDTKIQEILAKAFGGEQGAAPKRPEMPVSGPSQAQESGSPRQAPAPSTPQGSNAPTEFQGKPVITINPPDPNDPTQGTGEPVYESNGYYYQLNPQTGRYYAWPKT